MSFLHGAIQSGSQVFILRSKKQSWSSVDEFREIQVVGRGSFGLVRKVQCVLTGAYYALKSIPLQAKKIKLLENGQISLNEVEIMKTLDHPNVIRMFGSFIDLDFGRREKKAAAATVGATPQRSKAKAAAEHAHPDDDDPRDGLLAALSPSHGRVSLHGKCLHIVMELAEGGDLQQLVR